MLVSWRLSLWLRQNAIATAAVPVCVFHAGASHARAPAGEKKAEKEQKDKNYRLVERSYGSFARMLELPAWVDPDQIKASIAKGVLTVRVPRPAPAQTRTVEVKAAAWWPPSARFVADGAKRAPTS